MFRYTNAAGPLRSATDPQTGRVGRIVQSILPSFLKDRLARRFHRSAERVRKMEREAEWLRLNQSPLRVLGLPDSVDDIAQVRQRYKALTIEHHPDHGGDRQELERIRAAYRLLIDPRSMWYLDGHSNELARSIGQRFDTKRQIRWLAFLGYAAFMYALCWAGWTLLVPAFEGILRWWDPKFFAFMLEREAIDAADLAAGRPIDHDPVKLAPKSIKKLRNPGKYLDEL